jgi:thiamine biosynthesis protein ThiC
MTTAYHTEVRKHEEKISLGRHRHRWEDSIKMDLKEIGYQAVEKFRLAQDQDKK